MGFLVFELFGIGMPLGQLFQAAGGLVLVSAGCASCSVLTQHPTAPLVGPTAIQGQRACFWLSLWAIASQKKVRLGRLLHPRRLHVSRRPPIHIAS